MISDQIQVSSPERAGFLLMHGIQPIGVSVDAGTRRLIWRYRNGVDVIALLDEMKLAETSETATIRKFLRCRQAVLAMRQGEEDWS